MKRFRRTSPATSTSTVFDDGDTFLVGRALKAWVAGGMAGDPPYTPAQAKLFLDDHPELDKRRTTAA